MKPYCSGLHLRSAGIIIPNACKPFREKEIEREECVCACARVCVCPRRTNLCLSHGACQHRGPRPCPRACSLVCIIAAITVYTSHKTSSLTKPALLVSRQFSQEVAETSKSVGLPLCTPPCRPVPCQPVPGGRTEHFISSTFLFERSARPFASRTDDAMHIEQRKKVRGREVLAEETRLHPYLFSLARSDGGS